MKTEDPLLARFRDENVGYVLVGGQAVRLNGLVRATEDIDVLIKPSRDIGVPDAMPMREWRNSGSQRGGACTRGISRSG